jgi:hypothetical protein
MKALALVAMFALAACGNLPVTTSSDYSSPVKVAVVNSGGAGNAYLQVTNGSASSIGVLVPLFIFSESRYRKCGTGRIDVEGHLRQVPPASNTDISLGGLSKSNNYVGVFVYFDGKSDSGNHCLVWSTDRMS